MKEIANITEVPWIDLYAEEEKYNVYTDGFPVTKGHRLFVPKDKHDKRTIAHCFNIAYLMGETLVERGEIDGFNIGMNNGSAAGQTINWPHIHLIPRHNGDCEDPTGGVRGVIPEQQNYHTDQYQFPVDNDELDK